jgi:hypothetical protein
MIQTSCKQCIFAEWDAYEPNRQVDCRINRLKKFAERGTTVKTVTDETDGVTHEMIVGRICNMARKPEWAEGVDEKDWESLARHEVRATCEVQLFVHDGEEDKVALLLPTIKSLNNQIVPPDHVVVVVNDSRVRENVLPIVKMFHKHGKNLPKWDVVGLQEKNPLTQQPFTLNEAKDSQLSQTEETWYAVFQPGFEVPETFFAKIDQAVNDELYQFSMLKPNKFGNGLVVSARLHNALGGNEPSEMVEGEMSEEAETTEEQLGPLVEGIENKINYLAEKMSGTKMVMPIEAVVKEMA